VGQHAARQEVPEVALDERGEMAAACRAGRLREKRLQVLADDAVEDAALGRAGLVRGKAAWENAENVIREKEPLQVDQGGREDHGTPPT